MKTASKSPISFTRKETTGILTLLSLIALIYTGAHFLPYLIAPSAPANGTDSTWLTAATAISEQPDPEDSLSYPKDNLFSQSTTRSYSGPTDRTLFAFNPNELPAEGWLKLGIKPRTVHTIINYRNKGGRFRTKEDLQKIYGLSHSDYLAIVPYVQLSGEKPATTSTLTPFPEKEKTVYPAYTKKTYQVIDINLADTGSYIALPGIGSALAKRIVNFREKLGGFYRIEQVGETYGLPDSTFQKIKSYLQFSAATIKRIDLNHAPLDILAAHPYIKKAMAKSIVAYRQQHGKFNTVEELQKVMSVDEAAYQKIKPYVMVE